MFMRVGHACGLSTMIINKYSVRMIKQRSS